MHSDQPASSNCHYNPRSPPRASTPPPQLPATPQSFAAKESNISALPTAVSTQQHKISLEPVVLGCSTVVNRETRPSPARISKLTGVATIILPPTQITSTLVTPKLEGSSIPVTSSSHHLTSPTSSALSSLSENSSSSASCSSKSRLASEPKTNSSASSTSSSSSPSSPSTATKSPFDCPVHSKSVHSHNTTITSSHDHSIDVNNNIEIIVKSENIVTETFPPSSSSRASTINTNSIDNDNINNHSSITIDNHPAVSTTITTTNCSSNSALRRCSLEELFNLQPFDPARELERSCRTSDSYPCKVFQDVPETKQYSISFNKGSSNINIPISVDTSCKLIKTEIPYSDNPAIQAVPVSAPVLPPFNVFSDASSAHHYSREGLHYDHYHRRTCSTLQSRDCNDETLIYHDMPGTIASSVFSGPYNSNLLGHNSNLRYHSTSSGSTSSSMDMDQEDEGYGYNTELEDEPCYTDLSHTCHGQEYFTGFFSDTEDNSSLQVLLSAMKPEEEGDMTDFDLISELDSPYLNHSDGYESSSTDNGQSYYTAYEDPFNSNGIMGSLQPMSVTPHDQSKATFTQLAPVPYTVQPSPESEAGSPDGWGIPKENLPDFRKLQDTSPEEETMPASSQRRSLPPSPKQKKVSRESPALSDKSSSSSSDKKKPGRKKGQVSNVLHLWEFMRDLLRDPARRGNIIEWISEKDGVFRVVKSAEVARLWGEKKKNKKEMTYEKMSRSLRYSRLEGYFSDLPKDKNYPKKLCFKFGPKSKGWSS